MAVFVFVARIFLEFFYIWDSHYCVFTWSAIAILLAGTGSCLKVTSSGGSSLKDTSWAMFARVLTWRVPVRLMTIGIILTSIGCRGFGVLVGAVHRCNRCSR